MLRHKLKVLIVAGIAFWATATFAATSEVISFPRKQVSGTGPLPYNYRVIDNQIHAGGHPLNPANGFKNSNEKIEVILARLKFLGVETILDLENTQGIQKRYEYFLKEAGIKRLHIPMSGVKVPNPKEWQQIKAALKKPIYIHCKWGADRTGAIIGRYLVEEKGYTPEEAYQAVITGGTHAGPLGGLKTGWWYRKLKGFIWKK